MFAFNCTLKTAEQKTHQLEPAVLSITTIVSTLGFLQDFDACRAQKKNTVPCALTPPKMAGEDRVMNSIRRSNGIHRHPRVS